MRVVIYTEENTRIEVFGRDLRVNADRPHLTVLDGRENELRLSFIPTPPPAPRVNLIFAEKLLLKRGDRIAVIKSIQLRFGLGMEAARDFVYSYKAATDLNQYGDMSDEPWYGPNG